MTPSSRFFPVLLVACGVPENPSGMLADAKDTTAPSPPTGVTAIPIADRPCTDIQLKWTASSDPSGITQYNVYRDGEWLTYSNASASADTGFLVPGTTYRYDITAVDGAGNESMPVTVTATTAECSTDAPWLGELDTRVVLVTFADWPTPVYDASFAHDMVFGPSDSLAEYFDEGSAGATRLIGETYGWHTLPGNAADYCGWTIDAGKGPLWYGCDFYGLQDDALAAAGLDYDSGDRIILVVNGMGTAGLSAGTVNQFSAAFLSVSTMVHELGHSFGMKHAGDWNCRPDEVGPDVYELYGDCYTGRYTDPYDPMGVADTQFSSYHRYLAGWLDPSDIAVADTSGEWDLTALETADAGLKSLWIPVTDQHDFYVVEYRAAVGWDDWIPPGVQIRLHPDRYRTGADTDLLYIWAEPSASDSFYDPYRRILLEVSNDTGSSAHLKVTLDSDGTSAPPTTPADTTGPVTTITSPTNGQTLSKTVTLSATASDASGVSQVAFYVGGAYVGADTSSPYSVRWSSKTVANGTTIVEARATDGVGNTTAVTTTVTVSNPVRGH